jgi:hypothetical protein
MESIKLWARHGEAVRQAIELGELVHLEMASEELTDEFLLFAIESGLFKRWVAAFPDPRAEPEIGMEVSLPAHLAGRFSGLYSLRKTGYGLRSARVLGALGYSVEVVELAQGLSVRGCDPQKCYPRSRGSTSIHDLQRLISRDRTKHGSSPSTDGLSNVHCFPSFF